MHTNNTQPLHGTIQLPPSKSLANRAAILLSLANRVQPSIQLDMQGQMSNDTRLMLQNLNQINSESKQIFNAEDAGTVYRFMTARLALEPGIQVLTGSEHMKKRPIKPLVDALSSLGIPIEYMENQGYPPLKIGDTSQMVPHTRIDLDASLSSQYASALLMIAPYLPNGLHLHLVGNIVSMSYLKMTIKLMRQFGATVKTYGRHIRVQAGSYKISDYPIESDWSAASYFYAMAALRPSSKLLLLGLKKESPQGDAILKNWMRRFGVQTRFVEEGAWISSKKKVEKPTALSFDFLNNPDLAQTIIVLCAALGISLTAHNLQTLRIKETDRITALQRELAKIGVLFVEKHIEKSDNPNENVCFTLSGKAIWKEKPTFATYKDHRMAMAFAPLQLKGAIAFDDTSVVKKSFPAFWKEMQKLNE